jgi:hypothetical protein
MHAGYKQHFLDACGLAATFFGQYKIKGTFLGKIGLVAAADSPVTHCWAYENLR